MSDHILDQRKDFERFHTNYWKLVQSHDYPNAWGYFYGGHSSTKDQRHHLRFGIPMFFGLGWGVLVRANRYFHVPPAFRKERPAPIKEVQLGKTMVNVILEGLFPFRMWSAAAGEYYSLNLKCLVIEEAELDNVSKPPIDIFIGVEEMKLPFRISKNPAFGDGAIEIDINFQYEGFAEEWCDVGAWTQSTLQEPGLRPMLVAPPAEGEEHQRQVAAKWQDQLKSGILSASAAAASLP